METLQTFHGVLDRGFTGNMSFQFHIPHGIHELSVTLPMKKNAYRTRLPISNASGIH